MRNLESQPGGVQAPDQQAQIRDIHTELDKLWKRIRSQESAAAGCQVYCWSHADELTLDGDGFGNSLNLDPMPLVITLKDKATIGYWVTWNAGSGEGAFSMGGDAVLYGRSTASVNYDYAHPNSDNTDWAANTAWTCAAVLTAGFQRFRAGVDLHGTPGQHIHFRINLTIVVGDDTGDDCWPAGGT